MCWSCKTSSMFICCTACYCANVLLYFQKKCILGRCSGLGFNDGCCVPGQNQNCHGSDGICYCDEVCYNYGDCCEDIEEINCFKGENECIRMNFNCFRKHSVKFFHFSHKQFKLHQDKVSEDIQLFNAKILCSDLSPQHCNKLMKLPALIQVHVSRKGFKGAATLIFQVNAMVLLALVVIVMNSVISLMTVALI